MCGMTQEDRPHGTQMTHLSPPKAVLTHCYLCVITGSQESQCQPSYNTDRHSENSLELLEVLQNPQVGPSQKWLIL